MTTIYLPSPFSKYQKARIYRSVLFGWRMDTYILLIL